MLSAREGKPTPVVSWLVNGKEVDGRLEEFGQNIVVNKLTVPQLRREHRNTTYKCQAANTHLIPPLEKTVILDVYREYFLPILAEENFRRQRNLVPPRCDAVDLPIQ